MGIVLKLVSLVDDHTLEDRLLDLGFVDVRRRYLEQIVIKDNHIGRFTRFD